MLSTSRTKVQWTAPEVLLFCSLRQLNALIPEKIVVSVKEMKVGDTLAAGQIELPAGVKLVSNPETIIASCSIVAELKTTEELELEAPTAPEVITERKLEEGEEAEAAEEEKEKKPEKKAEKKAE